MCVVSPYIPSASVSDGPKDQHCLLYLAVLAGILVVMTTNPTPIYGKTYQKIPLQYQDSHSQEQKQDHPQLQAHHDSMKNPTTMPKLLPTKD